MEEFKKKFLWRTRTSDKSRWKNPRESIGERIGMRGGTDTCWQVVGPARSVWAKLGPEIKDFLENEKYGPALSINIYMIGLSEATAAPEILVCSTDLKARRDVRKAIEESGILADYPGIGVGEDDEPPDLLAQNDIDLGIGSASSIGAETVVLTIPSDEKPFGRRLFIPSQGGKSQRRATGGPILYINGNIYQLTVGHAFLELADFAPSGPHSSHLEKFGIDSERILEDRDSNTCSELTAKRDPISNDTASSSEDGARVHSSSSLGPEISLQSSLDSGVDLSGNFLPGSSELQAKMPVTSRTYESIGNLSLLSDTNGDQSLDYALVKLNEKYQTGSNEVPCGQNNSQRFLQVRQPAKDGPRDVNVITVTASKGFMTGKLCATASYVRFHNQRTLQEVFPVRLNGNLTDGDCGSAVIDQSTGDMYGHIVAGTASTGRAYIVRVDKVFQDIERTWGITKVVLMPPRTIQPLMSPDYSKLGNTKRVIEFASDKYFMQLGYSVQSNKRNKKTGKSTSTSYHSQLSIRPNAHQIAYSRVEGNIQDKPRVLKIARSVIGSLSNDTTLKSRVSTSNMVPRGKRNGEDNAGSRNLSKILPFEEQMFALPSDLLVHIIAYLCVPDILSLRLTSKSWCELITVNETPISRAFLEQNPVPRFAIELYPIPRSSDLNLHYVYGLWHRLSVVSKMSILMVDWITTDLFLQKTEAERMEFLPWKARMRRRLIPILFTIFHFFEDYRHLHLNHLLENGYCLLPEGCKINPVSRQIMNRYDNETLLQVHQCFQFLLAYLDRKLRPPSHFGRMERYLHGYVQDPLPEHVQIAIFVIGGLREAVRFSEIEDYDARRFAVDEWYSSVSQEPIDARPRSHQWQKVLRQKQVAPSASKGCIDKTATAINGNQPLSGLKDGDVKGKGKEREKDPRHCSNFSRGPPMAPLSAEHAQLLVADLPDLNQIWISTAEALLLRRGAIDRRQDIKKNGQVMHELVLDGFTAADALLYGPVTDSLHLEDVSLGWGDLFKH